VGIRLFLLGSPRFERDGAPVTLGAGKAIALLAYLVAGRAPTRDALLGILWSESDEAAARKNLRNTLWTTRRSLGEVIESAGGRLLLSRAVWADAKAFEAAAEEGLATTANPSSAAEHLHAAIALYAGPFLDGLSVTEAPEFELWCLAERERLAQLYLRVLSRLADHHRTAGEWHDLVNIARRALALDNLQESMHRALMEGLARVGDRTSALRQYDTLRSVLARELSVEPLPETEALRSDILGAPQGSRDRAAEGTPWPRATEAGASRARAGDSGTPFVGRTAERRVLDGELAAAAGGAARVVMISGETGIGKTRLWQEWARELRLGAGAAVFEGRGLELTQALPFAPVAEMFRYPGCTERLFGPSSPVSPVWLAEAARLLPEIKALRRDLPAPARRPPDEERYRLFEALVQCLTARHARPLVLFLDDAHWADGTTLDWLGYLLGRAQVIGQGLLLALAYRPTDAPGPLQRLISGWVRQGCAHRLEMPRLDPAETAALAASLGQAPQAAEQLQQLSAGNPYFLIELARTPVQAKTTVPQPGSTPVPSVPSVLGDLIRARLLRLSVSARQVLQAAAVLEPDFDFATLRRASGRAEEETLDSLDELLGEGLLLERSGEESASPVQHTLVFAHPLVATVVRGDLSGARRSFLYRRAAKALEASHAGRLPEIAGRLAGAYREAGNPANAALYAEMAARHALEVAAPTEAVAFYRQALAAEATPERYFGLGQALFPLGDLGATRTALEQALSGYLDRGDRPGAARACLELAGSYLPAGRGDEVLRWAAKGLAFLDTHTRPDVDPRAHIQAHFLLGVGRLRTGGSLPEAEAEITEAARLATEKGIPDLAARGRFEVGTLLAQRGDLPAAIRAYHDAIELAQLAGDRYQQILGQNNAAYHEILAGDLAAAHRDIAAGLALEEEMAYVPPRQYLFSTRAELALAEGQWDDAQAWLDRALVEAKRQNNHEQIATCLANLARLAHGRQDIDGAVVLLEAARDTARPIPAPYLQIEIDLLLAELYQQRGDVKDACEALTRASSRLDGRAYGRLASWESRLQQQMAG
jgi:DNA-binding SARP family transcriptional activator/tetratricopeptide (TPR) repeat protein